MAMTNERDIKPAPSLASVRARTALLRTALALGLLFALLLASAAYVWLRSAGISEPSVTGQVAIGGPFTLLNAAGKQVTDRDFRGKYLLVYFGHTFCPDVCPTTLSAIATALEQIGARADRVQPLFITIDPKRDTPTVIGQYTSGFGPRLMGLTGTTEQIAAVEKEYRVYAAEHRTGNGSDDYTVDHSSIVYLMGPDGRFIAPIRSDADGAAIAAEILQHLQ
jgi:protein SCO1/2